MTMLGGCALPALLPAAHLPAQVLHAAGIDRPRAIAVGYTARQKAVGAVEALHEAYPGVPIYVRALDMQHAAALKEAGERAASRGGRFGERCWLREPWRKVQRMSSELGEVQWWQRWWALHPCRLPHIAHPVTQYKHTHTAPLSFLPQAPPMS